MTSESRTPMPNWLFGTLVGALIVALGAGVMAGLAWVTGRGNEPSCEGSVEIGSAASLLELAEVEPYFQAIDERCRYWLATDTRGDLVAYKTVLEGEECVRWDIELVSWRCDEREVDPGDLERWPVSIEDLPDRPQTLVIDFGASSRAAEEP